MESHSTDRGVHHKKSPAVSMESKNLEHDELDPALLTALTTEKAKAFAKELELSAEHEAQLAITNAQYSSFEEVARQRDDEEEFFTNRRLNAIEGCKLTNRAALLTAHN